MLYPRTCRLVSPLTPDLMRSRLAAATLDAGATLRLHPQRIPELLQSVQGHAFVGRVGDDRFKLRLIGSTVARWTVRRGQAILLGRMDGSCVHLRVRPPLFNLIFIAFWCLCLAAGIVLSYFEPNSSNAIRLILAGAAALPVVAQALTFEAEAPLAIDRLAGVLGATGVGALPPRP